MPLPLTVSCFTKIQIGFTFLVPAHLGSPGKRAVKWVCVCFIIVYKLQKVWHVISFNNDLLHNIHSMVSRKSQIGDIACHLLNAFHSQDLDNMFFVLVFSALTLLVGWQEGHLVCKKWVVGCWRGYLSGARCRLAYGPGDATATHYLLLQ